MDIESYAFKDLSVKSSSGGLIKAITESFSIANEKAVVYGVSFDEDMNVVFKCGTDIKSVSIFCGSKYVFAPIDNVFKTLDQYLKEHYSMFVGLPCQVFAFKTYIEKTSTRFKFLIIDLICNGAPIGSVWKEYVAYLESKYNDRLVSFSFRDNDCSTNPYLSTAYFKKRREETPIVLRFGMTCF